MKMKVVARHSTDLTPKLETTFSPETVKPRAEPRKTVPLAKSKSHLETLESIVGSPINTVMPLGLIDNLIDPCFTQIVNMGEGGY